MGLITNYDLYHTNQITNKYYIFCPKIFTTVLTDNYEQSFKNHLGFWKVNLFFFWTVSLIIRTCVVPYKIHRRLFPPTYLHPFG